MYLTSLSVEYGEVAQFYYTLPFLLPIFVAPASVRPAAIALYGASLFEMFIVGRDISVPNLGATEFLLALFFILRLRNFTPSKNWAIVPIVTVVSLLYFEGWTLNPLRMYDMERSCWCFHEIALTPERKEIVQKHRGHLFCFLGGEELGALIAYSGSRTTFGHSKSAGFSCSTWFADPTPKDDDFIRSTCGDYR